MKWYNYMECFFAGLFLANFVPHFIHGISGKSFPTPFSNPPGKGMSSPTVNVYWSLFNLLMGYILFRATEISAKNIWALIILFTGIILMGVFNSIAFASTKK